MICEKKTSDSPMVCVDDDGNVIETPEWMLNEPAKQNVDLVVSSGELSLRKLSCSSCSHFRPSTDRCGLLGCGCPLSLRQERPWGTCPAGRWQLQLTANS